MAGPGFQGKWEQRWHPFRREWVVYSAHRSDRPWDGKREPHTAPSPAYDPQCYLCPGNKRVHGDTNPGYKDIFIFDNDLPVVGPDAPEVPRELIQGLYKKSRAEGLARVICYDPRHNVSLTDIPPQKAVKVFQAWREQTKGLAQNPRIWFALFFENKGAIVGTSNPHPHCQLYATSFTFKHVEQELEALSEFKKEKGQNLFERVLEAESSGGSRVVAENGGAVAFIPFFARWPFETWIFPKKRHAVLSSLSDRELGDLCGVFQQVTRRFDLLYNMPFPYVMSLYQAPLREPVPDYHLHLVLLPPLRQPGIQKFPAGPEIGGGNFMVDTLPEEKAAQLRALDLSAFREIP